VAAYSQFLDHKVAVQYRVGDILLSASATFAGDSGRSIFLEQHVELHGTRKYFRWEIPYPFIHRIEIDAAAESSDQGKLARPGDGSKQRIAAASGVGSAGGAPSVLPLSHRPKTA